MGWVRTPVRETDGKLNQSLARFADTIAGETALTNG